MNFSTNEKAIIFDQPMVGQIRIEEKLLRPKTRPEPSAELTVIDQLRSEYTNFETEDEKSADTKEIFVSQEYGTFEGEDSEFVFEEFDLDEYTFEPWDGLEVCSDCFECDAVEICHRGRKRR
jgi:hypothetical protein